MRLLVKSFIIVLFSILILSSCDNSAKDGEISKPASTDYKASVQTEDGATSTVETGEDFSLLREEPFNRIESDETCDTPVVMEFFAYQCPHCFTLESEAKKWKDANQGKVKFVAIPTHLGNEQFGSFLIVHHAAKILGVLDKATPALFKRIHEENKGFSSPDDAINFLVALGASPEKAKSAVESDEQIKTSIDESFRLLAKYKIAGVPTIIVNHKYQFDVTKAGGYDKVFDVVNQTLALDSNCTNQ